MANGYDHSFQLKMENSLEIKLAVTLLEEETGRIIEVHTSEPAIHLYTGNYLD